MGPRENESREIITKIASEVRLQRQHTLLESAHDVGGISVFIYLFAKVVFFMLSPSGQGERSSCWKKCFCFSRTLHYIRVLFTTAFPSFVKSRDNTLYAQGIKVSERLQRTVDDSKVILLYIDL